MKYQTQIALPPWVRQFKETLPELFPDHEKRMEAVIQMALKSVQQSTGGPFGAAIFDCEGRMVSAGVNMVTKSNCSVMHAEIVAIILAQTELGTYDLQQASHPPYELVSSAEPCAMCLGAIPWSGIKSLVYGARDEDIRAIGFDEGDKPDHRTDTLRTRGIEVTPDIRRHDAARVLQLYQETGGRIYNPSNS